MEEYFILKHFDMVDAVVSQYIAITLHQAQLY